MLLYYWQKKCDEKELNAMAKFLGKLQGIFETCAVSLLQYTNDLELAGTFELLLLSKMNCFYTHFASGFLLHSSLESKFALAENFATKTCKESILAIFQTQRQFAYDL